MPLRLLVPGGQAWPGGNRLSANGHIKLTAEQIKGALHRRHPAIREGGGPGAWTTVEEWEGIDLMALSAWSSVKPPIVGYEIKVSRSDYRRELLKPAKRLWATQACWQFYLVTPKGLLTDEEKAFVQPEHFEGAAFTRERCPERCESPARGKWGGDICVRRWGKWEKVDAAYGNVACRYRLFSYGPPVQGEEFDPSEKPLSAGGPRQAWAICETCEGRGYMRKSVVEEEAPTLWVPPDVGLVEIEVRVDGLRCRAVRKAPEQPPSTPLGDIGQLARWISFRPDPRHNDERERTSKLELT